MHLKSIKLAGFKSFVDPTTITFISNLSAIVGPNGCGKSNVIDAVRWVMGESSAKYLRGESMADVIFNGANDRKPISQAYVELIFDNAAERLGGSFAQYSELSIKRLVTRENQSFYYLNGSRCRRKDIMDIFLGTGLGPRSYAIIGQGTVSRLIEAKPDELRIFIEEAAGISKYKERRKETEQRMQQTRENLDRLQDLQTELSKQLDKLQQQARVAEKYQLLQSDLRQKRQQITAMSWQALQQQSHQQQQQIREQEVQIEALVTERVHIDTQYEQLRADQQEQAAITQQQQETFYLQGTELATLEQSLQHLQEKLQRYEKDTRETEQRLMQLTQQQDHTQHQLISHTQSLETLMPTMEMAKQASQLSQEQMLIQEEALNAWQQQWDQFNQAAHQVQQTVQVQQAQIAQMDKSLLQLQQRQQRLQQEQQQLDDHSLTLQLATQQEQLDILNEQQEIQQQQLQAHQQQITQQREQNRQYQQTLEPLKQQIRSLLGRQSSLETLQEAALGKDHLSSARQTWLTQHALHNTQRLGEVLSVQNGWASAVERVLGTSLQALYLTQPQHHLDQLLDQDFAQCQGLRFTSTTSGTTDATTVATVDHALNDLGLVRLSQQVQPALTLLHNIWCAENLAAALKARQHLPAGHSVITSEGIWLGSDWTFLPESTDAQQGVLHRQQQLSQLDSELALLQAQQQQLESVWQAGREQLLQSEQQEQQLQPQLRQLHQQISRCQTEHSRLHAKLEQYKQRNQQITHELHDIHQQHEQLSEALRQAREILAQALDDMAVHNEQRQVLKISQTDYQRALQLCRKTAQADKDTWHQLQLQHQSLLNQQQQNQQQLERMTLELKQLQHKQQQLQLQQHEAHTPQADWLNQRDKLLRQRLLLEKDLQVSRQQLAELEAELTRVDQRKRTIENQLQLLRQQLEQIRLQAQTVQVQIEHLQQQLSAEDTTVEAVLHCLPAHAELSVWQQEVINLQQRIDKLGAINLAAMAEFTSSQERYQYMQAQQADLQEALNTLESAIRKIDQETKQRFQETFNSVNQGFQTLFPKVFSGGNAYLALTGEDLLATGVTVMARPPGKRNSSIHSLSGGEKALTAIALVFAIFELNPAPFCMLDEVDAPLDDANVGRFCRLVEEMAQRIQFIYITHNKVAMEMAQQLMGVTMAEAGVSRLVSVDIAAAAALANV